MSRLASLTSPLRAVSRGRLTPGLRRFVAWQLNPSRGFIFGLIIVGISLFAVTLYAFRAGESQFFSDTFYIFALIDFIYLVVLAAFVGAQVAKLIVARRTRSSGSLLHTRLVSVFTLMALIPTVTVAIFSTLTLSYGLEAWFSERVSETVDASLTAANAYASDNRDGALSDAMRIRTAAQIRYQNLVRENPGVNYQTGGALREILNDAVMPFSADISESFIIDSRGDILARGENSYLFDYETPNQNALNTAISGQHRLIEDLEHNEFRVLMPLGIGLDHYLYVTRPVNGNILKLLDQTANTAVFYQNVELDRNKIIGTYAVIYLGLALLIVLFAVWVAFVLAERIARPVGRLTQAAQRIGQGDLNARVPVVNTEDEFYLLSRTFNEMSQRVQSQQDAILTAGRASEEGRRRFNAVLEGVSAGVIGLNAHGNITFINRAARQFLALDAAYVVKDIYDITPEISELFEVAQSNAEPVTQRQIDMIRNGTQDSYFVRINRRYAKDTSTSGYIISFDRVSELVRAQRMAAWGDVARRIAHEIKNPLTPIQLSAERINRRFSPMLPEGKERDKHTDLLNIIIRQTNDLRRIVDEFSRFARMPSPERIQGDWMAALQHSVSLQSDSGFPESITFNKVDTAPGLIDQGMIRQAFTNLIKNAAESLQEKASKDNDFTPALIIDTRLQGERLIVEIIDNGLGLPSNKDQLFEPYVTQKKDGTGLGLSIVQKIIEDHQGRLELVDAPEGDGAMARITLPLDLSQANRLKKEE